MQEHGDRGRARGFAFVEMSTDEEAQRAITELHELAGWTGAGGQRSATKA